MPVSRRLYLILMYTFSALVAHIGVDNEASAMDVSLGVSAVESGNETFRPGASIRVGVGSLAIADYTLLGRTIGPVTERTSIFSLGGRWAVGSASLYVTAGLSGAQEITTIKNAFPDGEAFTETSLAGGAALGVGYSLLRTGTYRMDLNWTSHIYPAGGGFILLAHGRKQLLTLSAGVDL